MWQIKQRVGVWAMVAVLVMAAGGLAQPEAFPEITDLTPESIRIERLRQLDRQTEARRQDPKLFKLASGSMEQIVHEVDELLQRFRGTDFCEEGTILKLKYLATLARFDPDRLSSLLATTELIAGAKPTGLLAAGNDYYAIQGFILGARYEDMSEDRRRLGAVERYEAFAKDHPTSKHVPVIRASLVRNLIAMGRLDRARAVVGDLKRDSADHRATHRAIGELYHATAVGKPFSFSHTTSEGKTIQTDEYRGRVVIVHFWSTSRERSIRELPQLVDLHKRFVEKGLAIVGFNVDTDRAAADEAIEKYHLSWPQHADQKGYGSDVLVSSGVIRIPTYFVIDRKGILRSIDPGAEFGKLVESLLAEKTDGVKGK